MSEVEKMYMRCEIKKQQNCSHTDTCYNGSLNKCEGCNLYHYPQFTAEKQLSLIKWLIQKNFYDERIIRSNYEKTHFYCSYLYDYCESEQFEKFEEALANVFNYFWQDLTEQERTEIRSILG